MSEILVIDDDASYSRMICDRVAEMGHKVQSAASLSQGLALAVAKPFDVVLLDVRLPDGNGLTAIPKISSSASTPEVIIITGFGEPDGAELAIRSGVWDYLEKTSSIKKITLCIQRALDYREAKRERDTPHLFRCDNILGHSAKMSACFELLARAAMCDANVLITGETGTGKDLFATSIHENSGRAKGKFVVVDCAALPATLAESILFGHEKGSFTGADRQTTGLVEQADKGTLFLDEIGELPPAVQKAFLRVIEERTFRPIGGREMKSDFRLIAATNRNLEDMVRAGEFREDLLFRLRTITIETPPLRERREDLWDLMMHHIAALCRRQNVPLKGFSPEFLEVIASYDWPGNVRQFFHTLERAFAVAYREPTFYPKHLPPEIRVKLAKTDLEKERATGPDIQAPASAAFPVAAFQEFRRTSERDYLRRLMDSCGSNIREACRISGLSRSHLYELLKKHHISVISG